MKQIIAVGVIVNKPEEMRVSQLTDILEEIKEKITDIRLDSNGAEDIDIQIDSVTY